MGGAIFARHEIDRLLAFFARGRYREATVLARMMTARAPEYGFAWKTLGAALLNTAQTAEALVAMRRATSLLPNDAEAHFNLGVALKAQQRLAEAELSYRRALELEPEYADAYYNLGNTLYELQRLEEAEDCYRQALRINPELVRALSNLVCLHSYMPDYAPAASLADARRYGELVARHAKRFEEWANAPIRDKCLRVGLVSGDLREHPVGYFLVGIVEALWSSKGGRVELFAYPTSLCDDDLAHRIKACCRGWTSAGNLTDEQLALKIREDGIDILIDLAGHTEHNRLSLFAWKPAPIQASWLGYFGTTGVAEIDYVLADPYTLPESEDNNFSERIWRLPETRLCFSAPEANIPVLPPPALATGHVTFGCFNNLAKLNDRVIALWARILRELPGSRLFLKAKALGEADMRRFLLDRFAVHGTSADQLMLEGASPRTEYLEAFQRVDITLDPFPFPGGTTSAESLWMGVPVLTLTGPRFISRQGIGLLMNAGLEDWIASGPDDYVERAVRHARNLGALAATRAGLRKQVLSSPLFDAPRFAQNFEAALRDMWATWCSRAVAGATSTGQRKSADGTDQSQPNA